MQERWGEFNPMQVGYVRVSTAEQNTARQESLMRDLGVEKFFIDYASGKDSERPELKKLVEFVREGDSLVVESVSRFARNTRELLRLVGLLNERRVEFVSRKEHVDIYSPAGKFMLTVFGAMAELERDYILHSRQLITREAALHRGQYRGSSAGQAALRLVRLCLVP